MPSYDYLLFGLTIRSELELRDLPPGAFEGPPDVSIRHRPVADVDDPPGYSSGPEGIALHIPEVGRFLIREGREILVSPAEGATARELRLFLLGSAFGALLHQRGLMPLHANAIDLGGQAIAVCGPSGAGKSTIAAWFNDRGHSVLADDVCVIGFDGPGRAVVSQGLRRLRLWKDALEASGRRSADFAPSFDRLRDNREKFDVPVEGRLAPGPVPLAAIYLLDWAADGCPTEIVPLHGAQAVETLVSNTYRGALLADVGGTGEHLMSCVRIVRQVPVFRIERVRGQHAFEPDTRALEAHARALSQDSVRLNQPGR